MNRKSRFSRIAVILALTCAVMLVGSVASAFAATPEPDKVSFTLEGCRLQAGETLPNGSGKFVCPDADYTTGNLGKLWNELDLVPYRLTASSSKNAAQTYAVAIALDNCDAGTCAAADLGTAAYGHPGYDVIGSDGAGGTPTVKSGGCSVADTGQLTKNPGVGGTQSTIYRILTITQPANATCVFDWYGRLALGSHLYPGSSLHANLLNQSFGSAGIGSKDVSIPVKEIEPQELSKDMAASQGQDHVWTITKDIDGAPVDFSDTCDPENRSASITVTIKWKRMPAALGGAITAVTNITVTNPAHRTITVDVTDDIMSGNTVIDTASVSDVDVTPGVHTVLTHTTSVLAGTTDLNDRATAHYIDKDTGVVVPGQTEATASATVQPSGTVLNTSAGIHDEEAITGDGLSFSVDSSSGASGTFTDENGDPYTLGTAVDPGQKVVWDSADQTENDLTPSDDANDPQGTLVGSVSFDKTIYVDGRRATSGSIADDATLTASDGFTASTSASGDISSPGCGTLTIKKETTPAGSDQEFTFSSDVDSLDGASLADGDSASSGGLTPGTYSVSEDKLKGWELSSATCDNESSPDEIVVGADEDVTCTFHNTHLAAAVVITKVVAEDHAYDGDTLHYTITVSNLASDGSNGDATDVNLSDLIQGTDHGCAGLASSADSGDSQDPGVLNLGETWVFHCTYKVLHPDENASHQIVNVATVTATDTDGSPLGPKSAQAVTPVYHPAIAIDKSGPETAQAGDNVPYILTVTNPGDESFAEATMVVSDDQCNGAPVTLIGKGDDKSTGSFDPGDVWTYTCSVQTKAGDTAIHNVAVVVAKDQFATAVSAAAGPGVVTATDPADTTLAEKPAQIVAGARITPGTARLVGPTGCTAKAFNARIRGTKVASVVFVLDGKIVKRVKNNKAKLISLRINPAKLKLGVHRLVANITFQSGSGTKPKTLRLSFQRCGKKLAAPRFTG